MHRLLAGLLLLVLCGGVGCRPLAPPSASSGGPPASLAPAGGLLVPAPTAGSGGSVEDDRAQLLELAAHSPPSPPESRTPAQIRDAACLAGCLYVPGGASFCNFGP